MKTFAIAAAFAVSAFAQQAQAQGMDANAMFAWQNEIMERQIAEAQRGIVARNVRDPRIVRMYYEAQAQGYRGSLEQFAYGYAATAGYTDQGRQAWAHNEERNRASEQAAQRGYQQSVRNFGAAIAERNGHAAQNQYDAGLGTQGRARYYDPAASMQTDRSYMAPGDNGYDPRTGRYYQQDARGNYYSCGQNGCVFVGQAR